MISLSPGPAGVELGAAILTSNVVQTGAGNQDIADLTLTVEVGARPILLLLSGGSFANSAAGGVGTLQIKEGATILGSVQAVLTTLSIPVIRAVRLSPAAGPHTYKVNLGQLVTGNTTLSASATEPTLLEVLEV